MTLLQLRCFGGYDMVLKHDRFSNYLVLGFQSRRNNRADFDCIYKKVMLEKDFKCLRYAWNRGC